MNHTLQRPLSLQPTTLCLIDGKLDNSWESGKKKIMRPLSAGCLPNIVPGSWQPNKFKSMSSVEETQPSSLEDEGCDEDSDYITFCEVLKKSPSKDGACSSFVHASFVSRSFSFALSGDDEDESAEEEIDEDDDDDEFFDDYNCTFVASSASFSQGHSGLGFDPFAVSGLFLPSFSSPLLSAQTDVLYTNNNEDEDISDGSLLDLETSTKLKDINRRWMEMHACIDNDTPNTGNSAAVDVLENVKTKKTVHFAVEPSFISIPNEALWYDDYKEARKGDWHQFHIDRERFAQRVESVREVISKVLDADHRAKVYRNLYGNCDQETMTVTITDSETAAASVPANSQ